MRKDYTNDEMEFIQTKPHAATACCSQLHGKPDLGQAEQQATNWHAIIMFVIFVGLTLFITKWAAKQNTIPKISIPQVVVSGFPKWFGDCG
jgi:hypothetical protein